MIVPGNKGSRGAIPEPLTNAYVGPVPPEDDDGRANIITTIIIIICIIVIVCNYYCDFEVYLCIE